MREWGLSCTLCDIACYDAIMLTGKEIAERDQAEAREREFERRAKPWLHLTIAVFLLVGAYAFLAAGGWVPAAPWSPLGKA